MLCDSIGRTLATNHPDELCHYQAFVQKAKGRVLLLGFGLGIVADALLAKEEVTSIIACDLNLGAVELGLEWFKRERIAILHWDAWRPELLASNGPYDCAFASIWTEWTYDLLPVMEKLRDLYVPMVRSPLVCDHEDWVREQWCYNEEINYWSPPKCPEI